MNPFMLNQFGLQYVPGVGPVEAKPSTDVTAGAQLGTDASIMRISGLGATDHRGEVAQSRSDFGIDMIKKWYQMVPWWVWVLIAIGALSAGAYVFRNLKKVTK